MAEAVENAPDFAPSSGKTWVLTGKLEGSSNPVPAT
jgi:hypothetical protein